VAVFPSVRPRLSRLQFAYERVRRQARTAGLYIELVLDPDAYDPPRHYAFVLDHEVTDEGGTIHVASELNILRPEQVLGILYHELGHVIDLAGLGAEFKRVYSADEEIRADELIRDCFDVEIFYDPDTMIQSIQWRPGFISRPPGLK